VGGTIDKEDRYLSPTFITGMSLESDIMKEEIFGPILPILTFSETDKVVDHINNYDRPLSLYLFSRSRTQIKIIIKNTISGSMIINHAGLNYLNSNLPFGGVKSSGIGRAHGYAGFKSFSSERSYLRQHLFLSAGEILRPPFNGVKKRILDFFMKFG
jgi:aldehyde dehydrogenase (NAD+)